MIKKPKITIDKYEIIDSGTIVIENNNSVNFEFEEEKLKFVFRFIQDSTNEGQSQKIELKTEETQFMEICLINFDGAQDTVNINLTPLATIKGQLLNLKYRVTSIGDEKPDKIFNYTWYLERKEENDVK